MDVAEGWTQDGLVPVALGRDEEHARGLAAWWISTYATRMGPIYPKMLAERFGMAEGLEAVVQAASGEGPPSSRRSPRDWPGR